ncbi:hypothetical protein SAMN00777080_4875 [Aquiflexum balticum DSM 16537]|uniref:Uncharacterized protein n=1 Tax=Aquiflexum balticum DSM 16537 TaxID=758820 RepID=A0A1W2HBK9_9BACT|nr:hypothetical protein SAMN00777080_4875 [Aquiflexum balticum DSM 16537]
MHINLRIAEHILLKRRQLFILGARKATYYTV